MRFITLSILLLLMFKNSHSRPLGEEKEKKEIKKEKKNKGGKRKKKKRLRGKSSCRKEKKAESNPFLSFFYQ